MATSPHSHGTSACANSCSRLVDEANRERSRYEQVKRFVLLPRDFTMEHGEVTPTLKLRRRAVTEHFEGEIEELYADGSARAEVAARIEAVYRRFAPYHVDAYQESWMLEIFTTSPVCGACTNCPPPM